MRIIASIFILIFIADYSFAQQWKIYYDSASNFVNQNDTSRAIEYYLKASKELERDSLWTSTNSITDYCLAVLYKWVRDTTQSENYFKKEKEIEQRIGQANGGYATACANLGILYQEEGRYKAAEKEFIEAKAMKEKVFGKENGDYSRFISYFGGLYVLMNDYEKAEPLFIEARTIFKKLGDAFNYDYGIAQAMLAHIHTAKKDFANAEAEYVEALMIITKTTGVLSPQYTSTGIEYGKLLMTLDKNKEAEKLLLDIKGVLESANVKKSNDYLTVCDSLVIIYRKLGQENTANAFEAEARITRSGMPGGDSTYKTTPLWRKWADSANVFNGYNEIEKAITYYKKVHTVLWRDSFWTVDNASISYNLGTLYMYAGKYSDAAPFFLECKQIFEKLQKDSANYIASCDNLAGIYFKLGYSKKAEPLLVEAKRAQEKVYGKENENYARICGDLALAYGNMNEYDKSEPLLIEARNILEKIYGKEDINYAKSCSDLGLLYFSIGQYDKAESLYVEAQNIQINSGKKDPDFASTYITLAVLYETKKQYEKAKELLIEGKKIFEEMLGKNHPLYAYFCDELSCVYALLHEPGKAESTLAESKKVWQKALGKNSNDYAVSCMNLGNIYMQQKKIDKARSEYLEAKKIFEERGDTHDENYGLLNHNLAILYWLSHQLQLSENQFKQSLKLKKENLVKVFEFTSEKEKLVYVKNILGEDNLIYSFYLLDKLPSGEPYDLTLFHRNLILSASQSLQKEIYYSNDTVIKNKYNTWINYKQNIAELYTTKTNNKEELATIESKANQLEKELTRESSSFNKQRQNISWINIQQQLKPGEVAIEFATFNFYRGENATDSICYVAFVLRKDKAFPKTVYLCNGLQLQSVLLNNGSSRGINRSVSENISDLYNSRGVIVVGKENSNNKSLYNLIWLPIEKELQGIKTIYFAPNGLLYRVAFAALPMNDKQLLSDKYKLVQLISTAVLTDHEPGTVDPANKISLYGGIVYDTDSTSLKNAARINVLSSAYENPDFPVSKLQRGESFNFLPGTFTEVSGIKHLAEQNHLKATLLSGIEATEESFKSLNGKSSPAIIHIATHGFFFPDPKDSITESFSILHEKSGVAFKKSDNPLFRSGLLFSGASLAWQGKPVPNIEDGILSAYEVSNMYLPNTKLVVLSACETALGDIQGSEGVYGLQRAFRIAGVQNLIMSLWKVPDAETSEFMMMFYKNLFAGRSINDAFYAAQTTMKNKYRNEAFKWSAWILVK